LVYFLHLVVKPNHRQLKRTISHRWIF
jgi:hypothetical protein